MKPLYLLLTCLILMGCSKQQTPQKNEDKIVEQTIADATEDEDIGEAELFDPMDEGQYIAEEFDATKEIDDFELVKQPLELTKIDIVDLVKQVEENPAMAEILDFQTEGRVISIKTQTDANGERIALVGLQHHHYNFVHARNEFRGYFYCMFTLQDGATLKKDLAIQFAGNILGVQERILYAGEYNQYQTKVNEVYASCYSPEPLADQSKSANKS